MENANRGKNDATLRIHSEVRGIEEISELLDIEPGGFNVKGTHAISGNPETYMYPANMWRLESDLGESDSLDKHLSRLADFVESREAVFKELIKTCEVDIFCGYFPNDWTGHLSLSPDLLKRLTAIPIKIIVKLYQPSSENDL
jgi:hypothetical protein